MKKTQDPSHSQLASYEADRVGKKYKNIKKKCYISFVSYTLCTALINIDTTQ